MKLESIEELEDGMWCRLSSGGVVTFNGWDSPGEWEIVGEDTPTAVRWFVKGLIAMGAEWYPKIPPGYRLATAEDREKGGFVQGRRFAWRGEWIPLTSLADKWYPEYEYIVPEAKPEKVYTVHVFMGGSIIDVTEDLEPGDRVTVRKVEA